jgi:hypothetical protein
MDENAIRVVVRNDRKTDHGPEKGGAAERPEEGALP